MDEIRVRISCILKLLDDYTGLPVKRDQAAAYTQQGCRGYYKDQGYVVFMGIGEKIQQVVLEGSCFQKKEISVSAWNGIQEPETVLVRLFPGKGYLIPEKASVLTGRARPGSLVFAFMKQQRQPVRLLEDYHKGVRSIVLSHKKETLAGACMAIWESEPEKADIMVLGEYREKKEFSLKDALNRDYQRANTTVCQVSRTVAEEDGSYFLLLKNVPETGGLCLVGTAEEKEFKSCEIRCGIWNTFHLTGCRQKEQSGQWSGRKG